MANKIPQSKSDLERNLSEHLRFLLSSAQAYDNGFEGEAKRLAVSLRVLLHDTPMSKSLLGQLGRKNLLFLDTCSPFNPKNLLSFHGLVMIRVGTSEAHFIPHLDDFPPSVKPRMIGFEEWWNAIIIVDNNRNEMSRKDLILTMADQDGGAHVDPNLNQVYANLSRENSLGFNFFNQNGEKPIKGAELASVRQITHEFLNTIDLSTKGN